MQKHAFLIIAHNNWGQLKKLIECLDSGTQYPLTESLFLPAAFPLPSSVYKQSHHILQKHR